MHIPKHVKLTKLKGEGRALFARRFIKKGEIVFKLKGKIKKYNDASDELLQ